jgi:hypothetical protein
MKSSPFIFIILMLMGGQTFGQYSETIRTARPGQAFGPYTTGKKIFQLQTGLNFNQSTNGESNLDISGFNYLLSLRYGITEIFEVRSTFRINSDKIVTNNLDSVASGLSALFIGIRFNILNNADTKKPSLGFQANVNLNTLSSDFNPNHPEPVMLLLHSQNLTDWLSLTTNWGILWSGDDADPTGLYTINLSFPVSKKVGGFVENYGFLSDRHIDIYFDTGIGYLVNNDLLLDISAGYGKNKGLSGYFIDFGVSWRTGL